MADKDKKIESLPQCAADYIGLVIKKMGYRKKARMEVAEELADHFEQALKECLDDSAKEKRALELIKEFGEAKLLAVLMRRAKKRSRPLWQKVLVRSSAAIGIFALYLFICYARLNIGSPTIKVNYAQWLTDQVKQGRDESLNARAEIEKATEAISQYDDVNVLFTSPKWTVDMNEAQKSAIEKFLKSKNESLETFCKALNKPDYWVDYNTGVEIITEVNSVLILNPEFTKRRWKYHNLYKTAARAMSYRICYRAYSGDVNGAVDDSISLFRFAYLLEGRGLLIEQILATAIEGLARSTTINMMAKTKLSGQQLKRLQDELQTMFGSEKQPIDFNSEKAISYAIIQQGFTDDGRGGGKMLYPATPYFAGDWKDTLWDFLTFSYPDRRQAVAEIDKFFAEAQSKIETFPSRKEESLPFMPEYSPVFAPLSLKIISPSFDHIGIIVRRVKIQREAILTILAVLRFHSRTGSYPDRLDELVQEGFLSELPFDPFRSSTMTYKRTKEGFLLYSWGDNFKDDGGQVFKNEKGYIIPYGEEGEWVFWPVDKK